MEKGRPGVFCHSKVSGNGTQKGPKRIGFLVSSVTSLSKRRREHFEMGGGA
jgi:hypothetical protein